MDSVQVSDYESFEQQLMNKSVDYMTPQAPLSLIVQQSLTYDSIDGQNFPYKLWFLINNPAFSDVIHWSRDGLAVVFPDDKLFVQKVLKRKEGKIFKTESLKSFVRQLNLYGFRKVMCDKYDAITRSKLGSMFDHESFLQGRPDLLEYVKRRCNVKLSQKDQEPTPNITLETFLQNSNKPGPGRRRQGLDFDDRVPKRRLRFSPDGKENDMTGTSTLNMLHRLQDAASTPMADGYMNIHQPTDNYMNSQPGCSSYAALQSNYFTYLQAGLLYPKPDENHNVDESQQQQHGSTVTAANIGLYGQPCSVVVENNDEVNKDSLVEDASVIKPTVCDSMHENQHHIQQQQPIVVTLPKSMMLSNAEHASQSAVAATTTTTMEVSDRKHDGIKSSSSASLNSIFSPITPSAGLSFGMGGSYLGTPTTLLTNTPSFSSPSAVGTYATTGPSPMSALCASLFSPFYETHRDAQHQHQQNAINKATQTSGGGPKAVPGFQEQAANVSNVDDKQTSASPAHQQIDDVKTQNEDD
eukprot:gene7740-8580_t